MLSENAFVLSAGITSIRGLDVLLRSDGECD